MPVADNRYDKDIKNRIDILVNGLKLPFTKSEKRNKTDQTYNTFYVDDLYTATLRDVVEMKRKDL